MGYENLRMKVPLVKSAGTDKFRLRARVNGKPGDSIPGII